MEKRVYIEVLAVCIVAVVVLCVDAQPLSDKKRYCFQYSWLGPKYNNESEFANATCDDITLLADNVPCRHPLVVTYDGSYPDNEYLWSNYDTQVACLLADGDVCASYTYLFNGYIQNVTYMCTKVSEEGGGAIESGCQHAMDGNREVHVCMCRSLPGGKPCNSAPGLLSVPFLLISIMIAANHIF